MIGKTLESNIIIITAPSGTGKTTLCKMLLDKHDDIEFSVSTTTREPRVGEVHKKNYYFTTIEKFTDLISAGAFVEWAKVHGNYYGTQKCEISRILKSGKKCLLDVDVQGGLNLMKQFPGCKSVFIEPPSLDELKIRLCGRNTDCDDVIKLRLNDAIDELKFKDKYMHRIVNDKLDDAFYKLENIIYTF
jgi:guanylate kinase